MDLATGGVAGNHGFARNLGRFQAGLPSGVGAIGDHADPVHFLDHAAAKVAQARIRFFRAAIADHVATLIGQMHHADSQLEKDPQVSQFVRDGNPLLGQRYPVAGKIQAVASLFFCGCHVVGYRGPWRQILVAGR